MFVLVELTYVVVRNIVFMTGITIAMSTAKSATANVSSTKDTPSSPRCFGDEA